MVSEVSKGSGHPSYNLCILRKLHNNEHQNTVVGLSSALCNPLLCPPPVFGSCPSLI